MLEVLKVVQTLSLEVAHQVVTHKAVTLHITTKHILRPAQAAQAHTFTDIEDQMVVQVL
jgi:hypothetical protein